MPARICDGCPPAQEPRYIIDTLWYICAYSSEGNPGLMNILGASNSSYYTIFFGAEFPYMHWRHLALIDFEERWLHRCRYPEQLHDMPKILNFLWDIPGGSSQPIARAITQLLSGTNHQVHIQQWVYNFPICCHSHSGFILLYFEVSSNAN